MRRQFSTKERRAIYQAAGGRCQGECGQPLGPRWHADHIQAFVFGGPTTVANGQALCHACHRTKDALIFRKGRGLVADRAAGVPILYTVHLSREEGRAVKVLRALRDLTIREYLAGLVRTDLKTARKSGELKGA